MAGPGQRPKDPDKRARRNKDPIPQTALALRAVPPPSLPDAPEWMDGGWPAMTLAWWQTWAKAAQSEIFTATDWDFLLDTALIHALAWRGEVKHLPELRLRVAKFGATAEDRARLRMVASDGSSDDQAEQRPVKSARERYGKLRAVPGAVAGA